MFEKDALLFGQLPTSGAESLEKVQAIKKSLGVDYSMGTTDQTGGSAIRHESLESTLKWVEASETSPNFWRTVKKGKAKAAVEEFAILDQIAQGQSYGEFGLPEGSDGSLERGYEQVKLVGAIGKVSFFAKSNDTLVEAEAVETRVQTVGLLKTLDVICWRGDAAKIPTEPNGIIKQAKARMKNPTQNVVDMRGKRMRPEELTSAGRIIADNYGNAQNLSVWMDNSAWENYTIELLKERRFMVGSAEARTIIANAKNFELGGGQGVINTDIFMRHRGESYLGALHPKLNADANAFAATSTNAPTLLDGDTCAITVQNDSASKLEADTYDYCIVPVNRYGAGKGFQIPDITITAGQKATFTTLSDNGSASGYEATKFDIYRRKASSTNLKDFRFLMSVAAGTSNPADSGAYIPGTTDVVVFDWDFDQVFSIDQLLPMVKLPLATIADYKWWLQKIYFTPKVFNGSKIVIFENVGELEHS